jgi:hypothetical protein
MCCLASAPFYTAAYSLTNFAASMTCLSFACTIGQIYLGVGYAIILQVSPPYMRALGILYPVCGFLSTVAFISCGIVVTLVGLFNTSLAILQVCLLTCACGGSLISAFAFYGASKAYPADLTRKHDRELLPHSPTTDC